MRTGFTPLEAARGTYTNPRSAQAPKLPGLPCHEGAAERSAAAASAEPPKHAVQESVTKTTRGIQKKIKKGKNQLANKVF